MWTLGGLIAIIGCTSSSESTDTVDTGPTDTGPTDTGPPHVPDWPVDGINAEPLEDLGTVIQVTWTQTEAADASWVAYTYDGADVWMETPVRPAAAGHSEAVLLGIPADRSVTFEIYSEINGEVIPSTAQHTTRTAPLPEDLSAPSLRVPRQDGLSDEEYVIISVDVGASWFQGPFYVLILNRDAEVVWYRQTSNSRSSMFPRVARSGDHLVIDETTLYTFDRSLTPTITRTTLDGRHAVETELPGMHFAYDELDDGSFLYGATANDVEFFLDRHHPDGSTERIWACYPWIQAYTSENWACAVNAVVWRPETNTVLWSMFETSTVVELDLQTGDILRQFGQLPDGFAFDPPTSMLSLQHYPNYTPDGNLLVSTHIEDVDYAQRVREFVVDDDNQTLQEVWTYGEESPYYARYAGEAQRLLSGNTLVNYGTDGALQEVSPEGTILWEIEWHDHLIGHATLINDLYALNVWDGD